MNATHIAPQVATEVLAESSYRTKAFMYQTLALLASLAFAGWSLGRNRKPRLQIPGPRGIPVFGSIFELRAGHAKALDMWAKQYGDMFRVVFGYKEVLILNTRAAVSKTLVKQGAVFQSRPEWKMWHGTFVNSANTGGVLTIGTMKWNPHVADLRRMMAPHTTAQKLPVYSHYSSRRYVRLIKLLAESISKPQDLGYCLWSTTVGLNTDQFVGQVHDDDFVRLICETELPAFRLRNLGTPLHDWVPLINIIEILINAATVPLKRIFALLGVSFPNLDFNAAEARAEELRFNQARYCKKQLTGLRQRIADGDTTPSQLGDLFRAASKPLSEYDQYLIMTSLSGSGMATGTTLTWLTGYLASHPEIQDKAYQALREVYNGEVPDPHDTDRVEYIKALGLEAGRYWTAIRLGFFREATEDTNVDGYHIPKGTMVVYNSFQINRDPTGYDSPDQFIPERWMNGHVGRTDMIGAGGDKIGVPHMGHGAGRRFCLGVPNVSKSLYGILALTLHFFKLERVDLDADGMHSVFPRFRADAGQCSPDMDPIADQVSACDAQAVPRAVGIRLSPRDPEQLAAWISEGHSSLQGFDSIHGGTSD